MRAEHPKLFVGAARAPIPGMHVEPQAPNIRPGKGQAADMREQRAKDAFAAEFRVHIDTLEPPNVAVPPIAPLICDHDLADNLPRLFRKEVKSFGLISQQSLDPR